MRTAMNPDKLKMAEQLFLNRYPGGFSNPQMALIGRNHKMDKMIELTRDSFAKRNFRDAAAITEAMTKVITRSSMVSIFEKPKFRDFVHDLEPKQRNALADGLKQQLYGDEQKGFEKILSVLKSGKMAKWSLISIIPVYFRPQFDVFVKPTTAKGIIAQFELPDLVYKPQPSWEFYAQFRRTINEMKTRVDPALSPNSAAFTFFLMMSLGALQEF